MRRHRFWDGEAVVWVLLAATALAAHGWGLDGLGSDGQSEAMRRWRHGIDSKNRSVTGLWRWLGVHGDCVGADGSEGHSGVEGVAAFLTGLVGLCYELQVNCTASEIWLRRWWLNCWLGELLP
jgi:hypothetical protein